MMRLLLALVVSALLTGCSTDKTHVPIEPKLPVKSKNFVKGEDFSKLADDRLCELSFVRIDPRIDKEIAKRKLFCDPADLTCRKKGMHRNSLAMMSCMYQEQLKNQSPNVTSCFAAGIGPGNIKGMTGCLIEHEYAYNSQQDNDF